MTGTWKRLAYLCLEFAWDTIKEMKKRDRFDYNPSLQTCQKHFVVNALASPIAAIAALHTVIRHRVGIDHPV